MDTLLLALFALGAFGVAFLFFFWDTTKAQLLIAAKIKQVADLRKELAEAIERNEYDRTVELKKEIELQNMRGCGMALVYGTGCCLLVLAGMGLRLGELVIIVAALTMGVGNPLYGYAALVIWGGLLIYRLVFETKKVVREQEEAKAIGNVYIARTNWVTKILGTGPDIYALYVFLVLVGLLAGR